VTTSALAVTRLQRSDEMNPKQPQAKSAPRNPSLRDMGCHMVSGRVRLERQSAEDRFCGRLDAMQRLTECVRVPVVELNVVVGPR
jgi:hypothetical protein